MTYSDKAENLLRDVALELVEMAREAKQKATASGSDYDEGRHFAFYEAVSLIRQQAKVFGLSLDRIGLGELDVDDELL
ncbi:MAG: hypothetical protein SX243_24690 [Acidobacteriota bacterium]|nr:hypothetical protein [Acidobacteriota bacterium]